MSEHHSVAAIKIMLDFEYTLLQPNLAQEIGNTNHMATEQSLFIISYHYTFACRYRLRTQPRWSRGWRGWRALWRSCWDACADGCWPGERPAQTLLNVHTQMRCHAPVCSLTATSLRTSARCCANRNRVSFIVTIKYAYPSRMRHRCSDAAFL